MKNTVKTIAILLTLSIFSIGIFYILNLNNRRVVEYHILTLAESEGKTIEKVLGTAALYLLEKGEAHLIQFMDEIFSNDQVVYIAVMRSGKLLHAASKFEGYLPLESAFRAVRTFASPLGEIIEVSSAVKERSGEPYTIHIGYFFSVIGEIRRAAQKNFLLLTALQAAIILIIIAFLYGFNRQMLRQEMEIQKHLEDKEKFQEISLITAGISHELRNPLNSLYLSYQLLEPLLDHGDPEAIFQSQSLKKEIKRVQGIIERFSSLNRVMAVRREEFDLQRFFDGLQPVWSGMTPRPEIVSRVDGEPKIISDRELLTQIMANVVSNATEAGAGRVEITVTNRERHAIISIKDNGPGIPKDQLKYIFDPFVSFKAKGSGIGLALTRKMVLQLGGRIEVVSSEGHGTEFKIHL